VAWGRIVVEGYGIPFKDAMLFPGGAREWDWRRSETSHESGILWADVERLIREGATTVVLSRGMSGRLKVAPETLRRLGESGIRYFHLWTEDAVQRYNELRETEPVGGLFHTTC